jgi:antitoxin HicB
MQGGSHDSPARLHQEIPENTNGRFGTGESPSSDVKVTSMNKQHLGSDFDDFLKEEGILAECEATAHKRVVTWQLEQEMKRRRISRTTLASRMNTSRATLDRLFADENSSVSLQLLDKAALALGRKLKVELA